MSERLVTMFFGLFIALVSIMMLISVPLRAFEEPPQRISDIMACITVLMIMTPVFGFGVYFGCKTFIEGLFKK